jgi:hypothetical protein
MRGCSRQLAVLYGVDRATVTRAVGEVRPLLTAHGVELRIDGTQTQVRRPRANRSGRRTGPHPAVVPADLHRARHRRAQPVAALQRYLGRREAYPETYLSRTKS